MRFGFVDLAPQAYPWILWRATFLDLPLPARMRPVQEPLATFRSRLSILLKTSKTCQRFVIGLREHLREGRTSNDVPLPDTQGNVILNIGWAPTGVSHAPRPVDMSKLAPSGLWYQPGRLLVQLRRGFALMPADRNGLSDPYVKLTLAVLGPGDKPRIHPPDERAHHPMANGALLPRADVAPVLTWRLC